jgi:hypothetical protein
MHLDAQQLTIMLGDPPETIDFQTHFDWEDAVIQIPFDCPDIASTIADLEKQPDRLQNIRKNSIVNSLNRYDSVYRLKEILDKVALEAPLKVLTRETTLKMLAESRLEYKYPSSSINQYSLS